MTSSATNNRVDTFITLANADAIELVVHGTVSGVPRFLAPRWLEQLLPRPGRPHRDQSHPPLPRSTSAPLTFTCVPEDCAQRLGGDRDDDGILDFDETRDFSPSITGHQNPFQSNASDTTGDNGSTIPDGIPDGQNDFDGDGTSNAMELINGTNPADNLAVEVPFAQSITATETEINLSWDAAPLGEYQVMKSDSLDTWTEAPNGRFVAGVPGGLLTWDGPVEVQRQFYQIVRLR